MGATQCSCLSDFQKDSTEVEVPAQSSNQFFGSSGINEDMIRNLSPLHSDQSRGFSTALLEPKLTNLMKLKTSEVLSSLTENLNEKEQKNLRGHKVSQNKIENLLKSPSQSGNTVLDNLKKIKTKKLEEPYQLSFLLLGSSGAGKTSIIYRICHNQFDSYHIPSIQAETTFYAIKHESKNYQICFVDTCGLSEYKSDKIDLVVNCDFLIYVVDLTDVDSFKYLKEQLKAEDFSSWSHVRRFILGNKYDILGRFRDLRSTIQEYAEKSGFHYYDVSAKNNFNLTKMVKESLTLFYANKIAIIK